MTHPHVEPENGNTAIEKQQDLNLSEYGARDDVAALARRIKALIPGGQKMKDNEAMLLAQYAIALDANPFRGEIYGFPGNRGEFVVDEGYKLLVRYARRQMPYTEKYEAIEGLPNGDIGFRCYILRDDARAPLKEFMKLGAAFKEAYEMAAVSAEGIITKQEMDKSQPPKGWTWEQRARTRALKNALNRSHGAPSPKEIARESWVVGSVETQEEDWTGVEVIESPNVRAELAANNAVAREAKAKIDAMTDEEREAYQQELMLLLHGDEVEI